MLVHSCSSFPCTGSDQLQVHALSPKDGEQVFVYTPRKAGRHRVHVSYGSSAVPMSPFDVDVASDSRLLPADAAEQPVGTRRSISTEAVFFKH